MTETTLAYLAGVIDSDGFISAHRKKHAGRIYCSPLIGISGTDPEPHELAKSVWGGSFFTYRPRNPRHRLQFQWQAVGVKAATAIAQIQPYLRTKRLQASIALEIWAMIESGTHRTDPRLLAMAERLSAMNLRNPPLKQMTGKKPIPEDLMVRQFPDGRALLEETE